MSIFTAVPRLIVGTSIKVARLPIDTALRLAGQERNLDVDAAEAAVKAKAASVTGDQELKAEANRQSTAVKERRKAQTLHEAAAQATTQAEQDAAEKEAKIQRDKQAADERAAERKRKAEEKRKKDKAAAAKAERERKAAAEKAEAERKQQIEEQEKHERLEQLDREAGALAEKEEALTAADEAQRLKDAAGAAKAERKSS